MKRLVLAILCCIMLTGCASSSDRPAKIKKIKIELLDLDFRHEAQIKAQVPERTTVFLKQPEKPLAAPPKEGPLKAVWDWVVNLFTLGGRVTGLRVEISCEDTPPSQ